MLLLQQSKANMQQQSKAHPSQAVPPWHEMRCDGFSIIIFGPLALSPPTWTHSEMEAGAPKAERDRERQRECVWSMKCFSETAWHSVGEIRHIGSWKPQSMAPFDA